MLNLVLIDGNSLLNRAFYATKHLTTKSGMPTNAVFGFTKLLLKIIGDIKPDRLIVTFDLKGPTFRHKMYDYEQICRADHSRVDSYALENGRPKVIYDRKLDDRRVYEEVIAPLQAQVMSKFQEICLCDYRHCSYMEITAIRMFYRTVTHTSRADKEWLLRSEDSHYDNFARIGFGFKIWKHGLRLALYAVMNFFFRIWYFAWVKNLRPRI